MLGSCDGIIGQFHALCHCEWHMGQYLGFFAASVDSVLGVDAAELRGPVLTTATFWLAFSLGFRRFTPPQRSRFLPSSLADDLKSTFFLSAGAKGVYRIDAVSFFL